MDRSTEMAAIVERVTRWAEGRADVVGLLLVGSYARDAARPDSDVDLVLLTTDEPAYRGDGWAEELDLGRPIRTQAWGPILERRFVTRSNLEVEVGIGPPSWAAIDPVDSGTRRVITDGARVLHDPTGLMATLVSTCHGR